jgi:hypothetical protein
MPMICMSMDQGCWMRLRCLASGGFSLGFQNRMVATLILRRERSRR